MTKLKTLKEINKKFDSYCTDTRGDWSDFDGRHLLGNWNKHNQDLKQEAITWIKHPKIGLEIRAERFPLREDRLKVEGAIEWIKQFFNITEEDLK